MRRMRISVCRRSASFIFFVARVEQSETRERRRNRTFVPGFRCAQSGLQGETDVTEDRKAGPTPALSLDRTGFALDVTAFLQARDPFAIVRMTKRGRKSAPRDGRVWP
jgi:hypothetical protein